MKVVVNARNGTRDFECATGEKILLAGLRSGVELPYECGTGTCGTCKARRASGRTTTEWADAPGHRYLKGENELLMCQSVAHEDCVLEVGAPFKDAFAPAPRALTGVVRRSRPLTHDVLAFDVELEQPIEFAAGQFALLTVPGIVGARAYSMVNFDRQTRRLAFVVKKKPEGAVSERLFGEGIEGARLGVFAPIGHAIFTPDVRRHLLCIAGGSGIAGMMSILHRAAQDGYFAAHRGDVFFGVRTAADSFLLDELSGLAVDCGEQLQITVALSHEPMPAALGADYPRLRFETGFVHEVAGRHMQGRYQNMRAYLAGPPPAVDASIRMLLQARVSTDNIRYDKFS